jgi:four helix bundle protein
MKRMAISSFEDLEVWQVAHHLVLEVYAITGGLPSDQKYGLASQMQRAAVSVPANIAEGFKRRSGTEKIRSYNIAQGSLEELRYYFILCRDLGYKLQF